MICTTLTEKLDQVQIRGGSQEQLESFNTALFRTRQVSVPSDLPSVWHLVGVLDHDSVPV